jgi:hypothetical protein
MKMLWEVHRIARGWPAGALRDAAIDICAAAENVKILETVQLRRSSVSSEPETLKDGWLGRRKTATGGGETSVARKGSGPCPYEQGAVTSNFLRGQGPWAVGMSVLKRPSLGVLIQLGTAVFSSS